MKLAIVGIDGLYPAFLDHFADALPAINALRRASRSATLRSTMPPYTPQAWTTMTSGVNPGRHGVAGFTARRDGRECLVDRTWVRVPQLWDLAAAAGASVGLLNVPMTFPAPAVPGFAVAGMRTPETRSAGFTHPRDLAARLLARVPDYTIDTAVKKTSARDPAIWRAFEAMLSARIRAARALLKMHTPDVFFCAFVVLDRIFHLFFRYLDPGDALHATAEGERVRARLAPLLAMLDAYVAELAARADATVLVSDHGFRAEEGKFYAPIFLAAHGLLVLPGGARRRVRDMILRVLGRERLKRLLPARVIEHELAASGAGAPPSARAWAAPLAAQGIFTRDAQALADTIALVQDLRDPRDGTCAATLLARREELYRGPALDAFPHLVIELGRGGIEVSPHAVGPHVFAFSPASWAGGHHDRSGVVAVKAPALAAGPCAAPWAMEDVLPTVLALLGIAPPPHLEGRAFGGGP